MTTIERLVLMANQIARNLEIGGEDVATVAMAQHIADFWDPRMKQLISAHVAAGGDGLTPIAKAAMERLALPLE
ncbi:formate dehydrogenase subunit delta [Sphingomonas sp. 28-63-12]|uniref:formate dehydrogenase subunit delta n=1 Tax=Sphingomonas sp. 28-63-12 TaxID=1970434 RepID=UPI000BC3BD45|nr:MAG: hypothetical protein B7Y47_09695 [Sphingomonas sp. 28-63-12]